MTSFHHPSKIASSGLQGNVLLYYSSCYRWHWYNTVHLSFLNLSSGVVNRTLIPCLDRLYLTMFPLRVGVLTVGVFYSSGKVMPFPVHNVGSFPLMCCGLFWIDGHIWVQVPYVFFEPFPNGFGWLSNVLSITFQLAVSVPVYNSTLLFDVIFILGCY